MPSDGYSTDVRGCGRFKVLLPMLNFDEATQKIVG